MDLKTFRRIVARAIDALPGQFRDALTNLEIVVEDWPTEEEFDYFADREGRNSDDDDDLLLGLYQGTPLPERHETMDTGLLPDRITLYRRAIEEFCEGDEKAMAEEIRITLLHELGHYFGIDEARLKELGCE